MEAGEVFGFLGPNGAGKTTTLKLLTGMIFPTSGRTWILNKPISDSSLRSIIGFLPENPQFPRYLTAEELLTLYGNLFFLPCQDIKDKVPGLLKLVGLETDRKVYLHKFSRGMVQRMGIAQSLLNDPQVLILDEPMAGLDPLGRKLVSEIILKLKKEGKTVFFSSHILADAEMVCDRVGIIAEGKLRKVGKVSELIESLKLDQKGSLGDVFEREVKGYS